MEKKEQRGAEGQQEVGKPGAAREGWGTEGAC